MSGIVGSKLNHRGSGPVAKLGTDGQHLLSSGAGKSANYETVAAAETFDDDKLQSNIALLGFKTAVNGSLAKYNLQDQIVDEFNDTSGVDASASTNEARNLSAPYYYFGGTVSTPTITSDHDETGTDGDYTWYKWTDTAATGSYETDVTQDHEYLIVGGGGSGGKTHVGGGGGGGVLAATGLSLTGGNEYTVTIGAGGAAVSGTTTHGNAGNDSILSGTGISTLTAGGGGYGASYDDGDTPGDGRATNGNGGGGPYNPAACGGGTGDGAGFDGGDGTASGPNYGAGGGAGAGADGQDGTAEQSGDGGVGVANDIIETGTDVYYAGGGGGGSYNYGAGGNGGGGAGTRTGTAGSGTANTGGGGGGKHHATGDSGAGGSGIVILRRLTTATSAGEDLTLQSTDTTAMTEPDYADMVILMENSSGTATINTDIKGYISKDSGSTFTEGTLVDEGTWGTNKKIYAFHDLDISAQSGTSMCYKITTHNQVASSLETKIHATSIGWKA
jgi:hypothetical protein